MHMLALSRTASHNINSGARMVPEWCQYGDELLLIVFWWRRDLDLALH